MEALWFGFLAFMIFPKVYAAAFSGLYFGLILALWLLVGRGLGLELRHERDNPLWRQACDAAFALSSAGLPFVFGVALGNVVRGVPLNRDGYFHLSLFDILNWYAVLIGVFGLAVLAMHGASFLAFRATGELADRAGRWARVLWWPAAALFAGLLAPTYDVRERMLTNLTTAAAGLYPNVLPCAPPLSGAPCARSPGTYRQQRQQGLTATKGQSHCKYLESRPDPHPPPDPPPDPPDPVDEALLETFPASDPPS